jgi:hypothetical protein
MNTAATIGLVLLLSIPAPAQQWVGAQSGIVNYANGIFYIDENRLQFPEARFREIPTGKSLRTGQGWVELQLGPFAFLWMGEEGVLRMENPSLTDTELLVERGSAIVEIYGGVEQTKNNSIRIRSGEAVVELKDVGLYRVDSAPPQVRVYEGKAAIQRSANTTMLKQGRSAGLNGSPKAARFDTKQMDSLREHAMGRSAVLTGPIKEARRQQQELMRRAAQMQQEQEARAGQTRGAEVHPSIYEANQRNAETAHPQTFTNPATGQQVVVPPGTQMVIPPSQ